MFKLVRRETLGPNVKIENPFTDVAEHPCAVVLLVKQYMSSSQMSQWPQVCFPFSSLEYLPESAISKLRCSLLPREGFSERQQREFSKTAGLVEQPPWHLHRAAKYLRELLHNNKTTHDNHRAPDIHWVFEDTGGCAPRQIIDDPAIVFDTSFAVTTPVPVIVQGGLLNNRGGRRGRGRGQGRGTNVHRSNQDNTESAKGAPPGSSALECGQPSGSTAATQRKRKNKKTHTNS